jgi:L-alanine-DL-glutamate epimerase-like enolase superfamily enzyme
MIQQRGVDMVQPDLIYNGGFIRCLRVARLAAEAGMWITPHCPRADPNTAYMLHLASVVPNLGPYQEYRAQGPAPSPWWVSPSFEARGGVVEAPAGPGLGVEYDPALWERADIL